MGIFTANKFSKITTFHYESVSDKEILNHMVSVNRAKKHLSADYYSEFMDLFKTIASENKPFPTNLARFWDRAFAVAHLFERIGFPYEDIYASDTLYNTYIETKEGYDQLVETIVNDYYNAIDSIVDICDLDDLEVHQCAVFFLQMLSALFLDAGQYECRTDYLPSFLDAVVWFYQKTVDAQCGVYVDAQEELNALFDELSVEYNDAYDNNDSVEAVIEDFTKRFLKFIDADPNNDKLYEIMDAGTFELSKIAFEEAQKNLTNYKHCEMRRG